MRRALVVGFIGCVAGCGSSPAARPVAGTATSSRAAETLPAAAPAATPAAPGEEGSAAQAAPASQDAAASTEAPTAGDAASPASVEASRMVPPNLVEANRIKGSILIPPDDVDKMVMVDRHLSRVIASFKLCLADTGAITSVTLLRSSGLPKYDEKIRSRMKDWQYRPLVVDGKPIPVCTTVTIVYKQVPR